MAGAEKAPGFSWNGSWIEGIGENRFRKGGGLVPPLFFK